MIVLLTGMFRSGSTWAFNVAKALLSLKTRTVAGDYRNDIGAALAALDWNFEHYLIKTHMPDRIGHMLIRHRMATTVCTHRDPLECIASSMEVFGSGFEETVALARGALAFLEVQSKESGILFMAHDAITAEPERMVAAIAAHLGCAASADDIRRIAELFSKANVARFVAGLAPATGAPGVPPPRDPATLLHPGHIRSRPTPPDRLLSPEQRRYALDQLAGFVDAHGRLAPEIRRRLDAAGPR
jgi:hypothetical protein